jgi:hypothetical protein
MVVTPGRRPRSNATMCTNDKCRPSTSTTASTVYPLREARLPRWSAPGLLTRGGRGQGAECPPCLAWRFLPLPVEFAYDLMQWESPTDGPLLADREAPPQVNAAPPARKPAARSQTVSPHLSRTRSFCADNLARCALCSRWKSSRPNMAKRSGRQGSAGSGVKKKRPPWRPRPTPLGNRYTNFP